MWTWLKLNIGFFQHLPEEVSGGQCRGVQHTTAESRGSHGGKVKEICGGDSSGDQAPVKMVSY